MSNEVDNKAVNKLEVGKRVFNACGDSLAKCKYYYLYEVGTVKNITNDLIRLSDGMLIFPLMEDRFLKPNTDGFCYYITELENMEQYRDDERYKIPTKILMEHMATYKSPFKSD